MWLFINKFPKGVSPAQWHPPIPFLKFSLSSLSSVVVLNGNGRLYGNISFQKPHSSSAWIKHPLSSKAWASLNSPQQRETFQGFMHFEENVKPIQYFPVNEKIHIHIFRPCLPFLCQRQLLILFTSVIIINKKVAVLRECQMRHKKTTAVAVAQLNKGGRKRKKERNPN